MRHILLMDPLEKLTVNKDTTAQLALLHSALFAAGLLA